jgi:hypothetical protein
MTRLINAALPLACNYEVDFVNQQNNPPNVVRLFSVLSQAQWSYIFPVANSVYTYQ